MTGGATDNSQEKQLDLSPEGDPREYFHMSRKFLGPHAEIAKQDINLAECVSARSYCAAMMQRYVTLLDCATFMPSEHIQKEKEYVITWRTAFKAQLK